MSEQGAGTRWESAPNACKQAAGLISLCSALPANYQIVRDTDACATHSNSIVLSALYILSIYTQIYFP